MSGMLLSILVDLMNVLKKNPLQFLVINDVLKRRGHGTFLWFQGQ
jgi:hypothetical protein